MRCDRTCRTRVRLATLAVAGLVVTAAAAEPDLRLIQAAADRDRATVETLLHHGVDVNTARADGVTALLWAAHWDDLVMADLLLQAGADVNAADDHGVTPLERAAENASHDMTTRLLAAGADPNRSQTSGLTPLMTAARTGDPSVVSALLTAGADPNAATSATESTPLMWAVAAPHPEVVDVLLAAGADPRATTRSGFTPLLFAVRNGDLSITRRLIEAGVDVNETGSDGTHALPLSIASGWEELAHFLLDAGADPNSAMGGVHALHVAAGNTRMWLSAWSRRHGGTGRGRLTRDDRLRLVRELLDRGADPNVRTRSSAMIMVYIGYPRKGAFESFACGTGDLRGATPLWVAAFNANGAVGRAFGMKSFDLGRHESSAEIMQALLDAGADPHLTTDDGTTPLMVAAGLGRATHITRQRRAPETPNAVAAVQVLLDAGADVDAMNEADFTALHGAAFRGLNDVIEVLVGAGADLDARDFRGRTPFRLAEGSKQSFAYQEWPETAELLSRLGANTRLGLPGTVQERIRDIPAGVSDPITQQN